MFSSTGTYGENFLIGYNLLEKEDMAVQKTGMVIDCTIEYICAAKLKISFKVLEFILLS